MQDTHCHLDQYPDPLAVAQAAERARVVTIGVTTLPSHFQEGREFVRHFRHVRLALGLHPLAAAQHTSQELNLFKALLPSTSFVGEVGLDFSRAGKATADRQLASFRYVLEQLQQQRRFVTLHSRGAEAYVLALLTEYRIPSAVFHWYTGTMMQLESIQAEGHYFSINPAMLRSQSGRAVVQRIAPDRALLESDGPYVRWGNRAILPTDSEQTLADLARLWQVDTADLRTQLQQNFRSLIGAIKTTE